MSPQFLTDLHWTLIRDSDGPLRAVHRLDKPLLYHTSLLWHGEPLRIICVPEGFESDGASVPRLPGAWLIAGGVGNRAAVVHDYLCATRPWSSELASDIFAEALAASGVSLWRRGLMWAAVRWFGPRWG